MNHLQTPRLMLLPIASSDLAPLAALFEDERVMRYLPGGQARTQAATQSQLDYMLSHWAQYGFGVWAIRFTGQAEMIGYCGLQYLHAEPHGVSEETALRLHEVELLYGLQAGSWGQGIGREAAAAVLHYGFEDLRLPRIVAAIHPDNQASRRILERLGLKADPRLDFYGDCPHFSLTSADYCAQTERSQRIG
jgi:[ribosomal protein S5]-alanine N-acetyltransferase